MRKLDTKTIVVASHNKGKIAEIADLNRPTRVFGKIGSRIELRKNPPKPARLSKKTLP